MIPNRPEDDADKQSNASDPKPIRRSTIKVGDDALRHLFAGCCEYAFEAELGVADPPLVDYMVEMLLRFARSESFHSARNPLGKRLSRLTELLAEADQREGRPRRELHRHIGDVTLFWTGVYPEALPRLQSIDSSDFFVDFPQQGRRCYSIASECNEPVADEPEVIEAAVLKRIADEYPICQQGLSLARKEWEALRN